MKNYLIVTNNEKEKNVKMAKKVISSIEHRGGRADWSVMPPRTDLSRIPVDTAVDCIITIGGDGTMVRTAQRTVGCLAPMIGLNMGHLGYLCDLNASNYETALDLLFEDQYKCEPRMMLSGYLEQNKEKKEEYFSLNDVVLTAAGASVVHLMIYVNHTRLYSFVGDGLIIATPTGSTAYNLSAHGPIVEPKTQLMVLTPINPHTLNTRSIILDPSDEIEVEIVPRRASQKETVDVVFDGAHRHLLSTGHRLIVRQAKEQVQFALLDEKSFLERMQERLQMT